MKKDDTRTSPAEPLLPHGVDEETPPRTRPLHGSEGGASFGADDGSTASISEDLQEALEPKRRPLHGSEGGASFGADDGSTAAVSDDLLEEEEERPSKVQDLDAS